LHSWQWWRSSAEPTSWLKLGKLLELFHRLKSCGRIGRSPQRQKANARPRAIPTKFLLSTRLHRAILAAMDDELIPFHGQLNIRIRDSVHALGTKAASAIGASAHRGMLDNSRAPFPLMDALEEEWRSLLEAAFQDAREFRAATNVDKSTLLPVLRQKLESTLPHLLEASRLNNPRPIWADVSDRINDLMPRLQLRLKQYELGIGEPKDTPNVIYSIRADTISGPIQQGTHHSIQNATVITSSDLFVQLENTVQQQIGDRELQGELLGLVREMQAKKATPDISGHISGS
jgi:hypothetical protein